MGIQRTENSIFSVLAMIASFPVVILFVVFPHDISLASQRFGGNETGVYVEQPETEWYEKYDLVAHAGGRSPNGNSYANSLEAFEYNYQLGHRVFEGDLCTTSDGVLVLEHHWQHWCSKTGVEYTGQTIPYDVFMNTKFYGTETPMDLGALVELMVEHEDMYFMTDFKDCYREEAVVSGFRQIVQAAEDAGRMDILDRFIIQNHHNQFKDWVDGVYPFENWLYTYYSIPTEEDRVPENLVGYCVEENIPVITMWHYMADSQWLSAAQSHGIKVFVHTVNDLDAVGELLDAGVTGVYTDDITPGQIESLKRR